MERDLESKPITRFAELVEALSPGAGGRTISRLLHGKATRHAALNWKAGRCNPPRWALLILADEIERRAQAQLDLVQKARNEKERLGLSAGALNLRKYHANKNR